MSSNFARAGLAAAIVAGAALAGCSAGRDDSPFVPSASVTPKAPVVSAAVPASPVVAAAPVVSGAFTGQAPAVGADPGGAVADDAALRKAKHQRKVARREEREAKARERRAHRRADHREAVLRAKLREARRQQALTAAQEQMQSENSQSSKPKTSSDNNKISASDVETQADRDRRADTEARAAVVRYHELLDHHDVAACALLTANMLHSFYGDDDPGANQRCESAAQSINQRVSVQILRSAASGNHALIDAMTYVGTYTVHQGLALVNDNGTWKIDVVKSLDD